MRSVNFRDNVLWAIAYRMGLDPTKKLLKSQAAAYVVFINSWVRRLWDAADWPEWTPTGRFTPNSQHLVSYEAIAQDLNEPVIPKIGKPLRVYLVDPRTIWGPPVDTPFRLGMRGVHVGFEHGPHVWIKFVARCPQFTSLEWNPNDTFNKDQLVYSAVSGECYMSKVNGNRGQDPSEIGGAQPPPLTTELMQRYTPGNPGLPAQAKIMDITLEINTDPGIPDPPPVNNTFTIAISDDAGDIVTTVTHVTTGGESMTTIVADLRNQLAAQPELAAFNITVLPDTLTIRLQHPSDFGVAQATYGSAGDAPTFPLTVVETQAYIPASPPQPGQPQITKLILPSNQVIQGGIYTLTFRKSDGVEHTVSYTALTTDSAIQILVGLMNAVQAARFTDQFFMNVSSKLNSSTPHVEFTIKQSGDVSLDAEIAPPSSPYWIFIPFPFDLAEPVVRGAVADAKGEQGQTDKQQIDEQLVPTEMQLRLSGKMGKQVDELTDQQRAKARYGIG